MNFKTFQRLNKEKEFSKLKKIKNIENYTTHSLCLKTGVNEKLINEFSHHYNIQLKKYSSYLKFNTEKMDKLIRRGLSLREIAKKLKCSREEVRIYIHKSNQYGKWSQSSFWYHNYLRFEEESKIELIKSMFSEMLTLKYSNSPIFEKKAYELTSKMNLTPNSLEHITEFFEEYYNLKKEGKKKSLVEFGEEFNISSSHVGRLLKIIGEGAMYRTIPYISRKKQQKL